MFLFNIRNWNYIPDNEIGKPFQCTFQNSLWRNTKHNYYQRNEDYNDGNGDVGEGGDGDGDGGHRHPPNCRHLLRQPPLHPTNVTASKTCHITLGQRNDNIHREFCCNIYCLSYLLQADHPDWPACCKECGQIKNHF